MFHSNSPLTTLSTQGRFVLYLVLNSGGLKSIVPHFGIREIHFIKPVREVIMLGEVWVPSRGGQADGVKTGAGEFLSMASAMPEPRRRATIGESGSPLPRW